MSKLTRAFDTFQHRLLMWVGVALEVVQVSILAALAYYAITDILPPVVVLLENYSA